MLIPQETTRFRRDLRRAQRRGRDIAKLETVVRLLIEEQPLPERQRDHNLTGGWRGCRECHIEPDWLLIYKIDSDQQTITFVRTGTHADLFDG